LPKIDLNHYAKTRKTLIYCAGFFPVFLQTGSNNFSRLWFFHDCPVRQFESINVLAVSLANFIHNTPDPIIMEPDLLELGKSQFKDISMAL
jgi:hypothetical protein